MKLTGKVAIEPVDLLNCFHVLRANALSLIYGAKVDDELKSCWRYASMVDYCYFDTAPAS